VASVGGAVGQLHLRSDLRRKTFDGGEEAQDTIHRYGDEDVPD